jgi:hypothetical protein
MRRRELLIAAAGTALLVPAAHASAAADEGTLLVGLWRREMAAAFAYGMAGTGVMSTLHAHETDHAAALATELAAVALSTPSPPKHVSDLDIAAERLALANRREEALAAAISLELGMNELYRDALPGLQDAKIAMTAATILGSHAQHLLILRDQAESHPLASR